ncbi:hypothetical protein NIES4072_69960 [Nostoc commune NIES-4072]|uniref:N-acetyltransferase domain-containing protein n=1 Tax=Nostoc commune NIES-4072 TaxID=2005467 RepID=A0A2R5G6B1_NOSCO|nr:hypothetical protein [Nostoc commune]BBD70629.1 hypothetical protein NIES4070_70400 [Nostoc commune HK-02]GBG23284.1 hypothetical protein NIES4072_69960 [Nostoc commune NIES-4072]
MNRSFRLIFKVAETEAEVLQCQSLIAQVYYKELGITFSSTYNPENKIELWPHHYLMGLVNDELVSTISLYIHSTNLERYGGVTSEDIDSLLAETEVPCKYSGNYIRELTKFVVKENWRKKGIGKLLMAVAHSKNFIQINEEKPHLISITSKLSTFNYFLDPIGIKTRLIKLIPAFKIHELYSNERDPMQSRLIIPDIDIPKQWYNLKLPAEYQITSNK